MTAVAIGSHMRTDERETASLVDLRYIIHDPGIGCMTSSAIGPYRLVMYIRMTGNALHLRLCKFKRLVALQAGDLPVLAGKCEFRGIMIECQALEINLPRLSVVAIGAVQREVLPVRRCLREKNGRQ